MKFHIDKSVKVGRLWATVGLNYGITLGRGDDGKLSRICLLSRFRFSHSRKLNNMICRMHIDKPEMAAFVIKELMAVLTPIRNALNQMQAAADAAELFVQGTYSGVCSEPGNHDMGNLITLRSFDRYIKKRRKHDGSNRKIEKDV